VTFQDMRLVAGAGADLYATYSWDNMGRMTGMTYPLYGPQNTMNYDAMSNLSSVTQAPCQTQDQYEHCLTYGSSAPLASASYNLAGQLTALNYDRYGSWQQTESHTYNATMQLTNITSSAPSGIQSLNMTYNFSATQNNGRIVSAVDAVTGESVSYTYDSLNRLIAAATTAGVPWSESYTYDGFGNMTSKVSSLGTTASPQVDPTTNRARVIGDYGFDANGNWLGVPGPLENIVNTWNVENQLISNGTVDILGRPYTYTYDPWGKRVLQYATGGGYGGYGPLYFYSITGQRLGTYLFTGGPSLEITATNQFFGGRLLAPVDRLGSVRQNGNGPIAYFPWGEERTSTPNGTDKFATYFRDSVINGVGEDYASARYYNNNFGRFWSPDPGGLRTAHATDPITWNRYAYVIDDPVNHQDRQGLFYATCELLGNCGNDDGGGDAGGEPDDDSDIDICLLYTYYPGCGAKSPAPPSSQDEWDNFSVNCKQGLKDAMRGASVSAMDLAVNRAEASWSVIETAAGENAIDPGFLAAVGIMESKFSPTLQGCNPGITWSPTNKDCSGAGVFQIDLYNHQNVSLADAKNTSFAADFAANMLANNMADLAKQFPNFTPQQLLQATAASYNLGLAPGQITGNPATIDAGTKPIGKYGATVLELMDCFN
jgi:RHS repeat-associated protein